MYIYSVAAQPSLPKLVPRLYPAIRAPNFLQCHWPSLQPFPCQAPKVDPGQPVRPEKDTGISRDNMG